MLWWFSYASVTPVTPLVHLLGSTLHLPTTLSASTQMKVEQ